MYKDEIKKVEYYKEQIINEYLKNGKLLSKNEIQQKIDAIDLKLAIFKQGYIYNGETLNLEKFQDQKRDLYKDLKILYELIYETAYDRLSKIQAKLEYKINYLNEITKKYKYRTAIESIGVYGDNVYYATNGFKQYYSNGKIIIDLGSLSIKSGSYLACMLNSNELIHNEKVIFHFDDKKVNEYSYNKDLLTILGNYNIKTYDFSIEENTNTSFKVTTGDENFKPDKNSKYNIFGGKDKIKVFYPNTGKTEFIEKIENVPFVAKENCEITFYIYGAKDIAFDINDKYDYKSFSNYENKSPKQRQKIYIKALQGFMLDFSTDGVLYAHKEVGYIKDDQLYSQNGFGTITDFMIEELAFGEPITINDAHVEIENPYSSFYDINYISIKETQVSELDSNEL